MKNSLIIISVSTALALVGCNKSTRSDTTAATEPTVGQRVDSATARTGEAVSDAGRAIQRAADRTGDAMSRTGDKISAEWNEWKLNASDLDSDLRADRPIVRTRTIPANAPTGVVNVNKSELKDRVQANVSMHAAAIKDLDVEIDRETEVVLTGTAASAEEVAHAIGSALSTEGITKVTSKIKLAK
jgi:osmotically-inducible protein OsmY